MFADTKLILMQTDEGKWRVHSFDKYNPEKVRTYYATDASIERLSWLSYNNNIVVRLHLDYPVTIYIKKLYKPEVGANKNEQQ